jgi:putative transposase
VAVAQPELEEVYLHAYETVAEAQAGMCRYFAFYNSRRSHQALARCTPDTVYFKHRLLPQAA